MDTAQRETKADATKLQAEITPVINQLIRLSLFTIVKKYHLPLGRFDVSPDTQGTVEPVSTNLYRLEITNDKHQSFFNITLDYKAIEKLIRAHFKKGVFQSLADELIGSNAAKKSKLQNHKWSFLGFVRDMPLTVDAIRKDRDFWKEAVLFTQKSARIPLSLKKDIPHYALFLVAAENADKLVIDADVALMIPPPHPTPAIEDIADLKRRLHSLIEKAPRPSQGSPQDIIISSFAKKAKALTDYKAALEKLGHDEAEVRDMVSELDETLTANLRGVQ
jgi:hypothetical protein